MPLGLLCRPISDVWRLCRLFLLPLAGFGVAGPTRLELATSGVTGRRSNQLNYDPANRRQRHQPKPAK